MFTVEMKHADMNEHGASMRHHSPSPIVLGPKSAPHRIRLSIEGSSTWTPREIMARKTAVFRPISRSVTEDAEAAHAARNPAYRALPRRDRLAPGMSSSGTGAPATRRRGSSPTTPRLYRPADCSRNPDSTLRLFLHGAARSAASQYVVTADAATLDAILSAAPLHELHLDCGDDESDQLAGC